MNDPLDPWNDASLLAQRLSTPHARLHVLIGAEAWCATCRHVRPQYDALAAQASVDEIWLWLDLEDHSEFIGDYLPDTLPMLIAYHGTNLLGCVPVEGKAGSLGDLIHRIRSQGVLRDPSHDAAPDPGIRARLLVQDWVPE
ncbi:thioredoxin [Massilia sp. P8910]|uniref:thioredoxin n=1 Tax=Massilia antarctica TaxID=2765360 RepID=UPI001E2C120B|nr:thioredoxin [Massilia antarctica]MCE3604648.1 thioredoxin [Massilia antarctica]